MTKEQLFDAIGGVEECYIRDAGESRKRSAGWFKWSALAACLVLVVGTILWQVLPGEKIPAGDGPAAVEYNGVKYLYSGYERYSTVLEELPEGYTLAGTANIGELGECPFYANADEPLRIYVYHLIHSNNSYEPPKMAYIRYVDARLRSAQMISYEDRLYIGLMTADLWSNEMHDVERELYDALKAEYDLAFEGAAPEGFVCLGEVEYTGPDTLPSGALAGNIKAVVWAHPDRPELLLKETYSHTYEEPGRLVQHHDGFEVFALYTGPLA